MNLEPPKIDRIAESQRYLQNATSYYENSEGLVKQKELAKAGELLWGAIAEGVKGLHMILTGEAVGSHKDIRRILNNLLLEYGEKGLKKQHITAANQLHTNFYETHLLLEDESDFFEQYDYAKELFGLLMDQNRECYQHAPKS